MNCSNNIKQISLALHNYHNAHRLFPPGDGYQAVPCTPSEWTWAVRVFDYIEQQRTGEAIDWTTTKWQLGSGTTDPTPELKAIIEAYVPAFYCPSDPMVTVPHGGSACPYGSDSRHNSRISYAANYGLGRQRAAGRTNGVFYWNSKTKIADIQDGTSNTLMLSELAAGHPCTTRGVYSYLEGPLFMVDYAPNDTTPDLVRSCDPADTLPGAVAPCYTPNNGNLSLYASALHTSRSRHPGGVMSGLCDGSVRFYTNDVSLEVWHALGTPKGGEVLSTIE